MSQPLNHKAVRIVVAAFFVGLCAYTSAALMGEIVRTQYLFFGLNVQGMMEGTTLKPFVFRVLPVAIVRAVSFATPLPLQMWVVHFFQPQHIQDFLTPRFLYPGYEFEGLMFLLMMYAFLIGYLVMLHRLACLFYPGSFVLPLAASLLGVAVLFPFEFPRSYPYDFAVLFLWSACFYAMAKRNWPAYVLLFTFAALNKETAILLILLYAIHASPILGWRKYVQLGVLQLAIYAVIRGGILYAYRDNPGLVIDYNPYYQFKDEMLTGYNLERLMSVLAALYIVLRDWNSKPLILRQSLWLFLPLYLLYRWGGCCGEWRVFFEIFPTFTLMAAHTLITATGVEEVRLREAEA